MLGEERGRENAGQCLVYSPLNLVSPEGEREKPALVLQGENVVQCLVFSPLNLVSLEGEREKAAQNGWGPEVLFHQALFEKSCQSYLPQIEGGGVRLAVFAKRDSENIFKLLSKVFIFSI